MVSSLSFLGGRLNLGGLVGLVGLFEGLFEAFEPLLEEPLTALWGLVTLLGLLWLGLLEPIFFRITLPAGLVAVLLCELPPGLRGDFTSPEVSSKASFSKSCTIL